jgi:hypothetical protein
MTLDRSSNSGPLVREVLRFGADALDAFGTAQSEALAAANCPTAAGPAGLNALGATIPVAPTASMKATGVTMTSRGAIVGLRVQQRTPGGGAGGETVTYVVQKLSPDLATLTTLLQPDGVTPLQVTLPATSTAPIRLSVAAHASAAFAAGDLILLTAVHDVLTVSGPTDIDAVVEFIETASG